MKQTGGYFDSGCSLDVEPLRAVRLAHQTADAYSADAWGPVAWVEAAQMLIDMGLSDRQVEGVLRSKLTRWARDAHCAPSTYLGDLYHNVSELRRQGRLDSFIA